MSDDVFPESAYEDPADAVKSPRGRSQSAVPAPYALRADSWSAGAVGMPGWARSFAATGKIPDGRTRHVNAPAGTPAEREGLEARRRYADHWRRLVREMTALKADCARVMLAHGPTTPEHKAAAQLAFDVEDEWSRLRRLRDQGAPMVMRTFPPVPGSAGGRSLEAEARVAAKSPLFQPRGPGPADGMDDDIADAFGGI